MRVKCLMLLLLCLSGLPAQAENILKNPGFEKGSLNDWNLGILGDRKGKIEIMTISHRGKFAAGIYSPTRASWTFLRQSFKLPVGSQVVAVAWVKTHSNRLRLALTEGYIWGDDATGHQHKYVHSSGSGKWERLVVKMTLKKESLVSIALGFDYGSKDCQSIVDDLYLGTGKIPDKNEASTANDHAIQNIIIPPALRGKAGIIVSKAEQTLSGYERLKSNLNSLPVGLIRSIDKAIADGRETIAQFKSNLKPYLSGEEFLTKQEWDKHANELEQYVQKYLQFVVWNKNIHLNVQPNDMPSKLDSIKQLKLCACINELESADCMISNLSSHPVDIRIELSDLSGPTKISAKDILLRRAVFVRDNSKIYADPLVAIDDSSSVCVPAYQTRQIWVTLNTDGLKAGTYKGKIKLIPLDNLHFHPYTFDFIAKILPVKLPSTMPINVFNFDYKAFKNAKCLDDLISHRVNTFQINISSKNFEDYATKELIGKLRKRGLITDKSIYFEVWFIRKTGWKQEYTDWINRFVTYTREQLGLTYKQWVLHIYDETLGPEFVKAAKNIKAIDANVQIFSDWSGSIKALQAISPYIDVWCPQYRQIDKMPGAFEFMKKTHKPIWTYECDSMPAKPVLIYHILPLLAFKHHLDGVCFWTYSPCRWVNNRAGRNYGLYYWNKKGDGPIASRRWEIWRDGLDDYLFLLQLKKKVQTNKQKILINQFVDKILANPSPGSLSHLKQNLIHLISSKADGVVSVKASFGKRGYAIRCYYALPTVLVFPKVTETVKISSTRFINEKVHYINCKLDSIPVLDSNKPVIIAARGESEPVQFVVEAIKNKLEKMKLKCTDLVCGKRKFSSDSVDIRVVGYTKFDGKTWPDPLFPQMKNGIDIPKNRRQAWWITVVVPKNQAAGIYKGNLKILSNDKQIKSVPFSVKVANFSLPWPLPMGLSVGLGIEKPALRMALERHFYPHNHRVGVAMPIFRINEKGEIKLDFDKFDKKVETLQKVYGMKYICLGYIMGDGGGAYYWKSSLYPQVIDSNGQKIRICIDPRKDEKCRVRFQSVMRQYVKHLKGKGWLGDSFIYLWDEPHKKKLIRMANEFGKYFKEAAPELPLMVTGYIKNCDIVCSLVNHCSDKAVAKCRKEGKHYWIYSCGNLQDPSLTVGKPALDSRLLGWVGFRYHAENFLHWGITINYQKTSLIDKITFSKTPGNGDGALFYAPSGEYKQAIPSIRSENLCDGIEDAIILNCVAQSNNSGEIRREVKKLIPDQHHYNSQPEDYMEIRAKGYKILGGE